MRTPIAASKVLTILVVDDDQEIADTLQQVLEAEGHAVMLARHGAEGLERLQSSAVVDLILLDLRMPVMDGWTFRVEQRRNAAFCNIPVIAMSADGSSMAAAIDAAAYIRKPFELDELSQVMAQVLSTVRRERARAAQLAQADRLTSIGMVAAGVAHEINNPLAYITANLSFVSEALSTLVSELPESRLREISDAVRDSRDGAERIRRIVRDLRCFSRVDREERRPLDVHAVLEVAINMSWNVIRHRGRLIKDFGKASPVDADEARLAQVFINLLVNAAQALPEGGGAVSEIRVSTGRTSEGATVIEVKDTGHGIAPADIARIFDPFFTTKRAGEGSGLGLPIASDIVSAHGGTISVRSQVGQGTVFRIELPASVAAVKPVEHRAREAVLRSRRGRVLVIDDEELVCRSFRRGLSEDHEVVTSTDPRGALAMLLEGQRFDAIFCDLNMPTMSGTDLFEKLQEAAPEQARRVVFVSGGAFSTQMRDFLESVANPRIDKPFDVQNVRALLRERLLGQAQVADGPSQHTVSPPAP